MIQVLLEDFAWSECPLPSAISAVESLSALPNGRLNKGGGDASSRVSLPRRIEENRKAHSRSLHCASLCRKTFYRRRTENCGCPISRVARCGSDEPEQPCLSGGKVFSTRRSVPVSRLQFGIPPTSRFARYGAPTVSWSACFHSLGLAEGP